MDQNGGTDRVTEVALDHPAQCTCLCLGLAFILHKHTLWQVHLWDMHNPAKSHKIFQDSHRCTEMSHFLWFSINSAWGQAHSVLSLLQTYQSTLTMNTFVYNWLLYSLVCHLTWKNGSHHHVWNDSCSWPCCFSFHGGMQQINEPFSSNQMIPVKGWIVS